MAGRKKSRRWHKSYDDTMYGMVERTWFGLQTPFTLGADRTLVKRYYPKGPIRVLSFGVQHAATQGGTEVTLSLARNSSTLATVVASTDSAPWTIASKSLDKLCKAGSYLVITSAGTVATGSVSFFIDWMRDPDSGWEYWT